MKKDPDYVPYINELLQLAEADSSAQAELEDSLEAAKHTVWEEGIYRNSPPPRLLKQAHRQLIKTIELIEKLEEYSPYPIILSWPRDGEIVTAQKALRDLEEQIGKPKRGNPGKPDRIGVISEARKFFARHSPRRPSADPTNPFAPFCELFFRAVTGSKVKEGGLEHPIRKVLSQAKETNQRKEVH